MLMINVQMDFCAFSVSLAKLFQGVMAMVPGIPGTIVTIQIVHGLVMCRCLVEMMAAPQTWRYARENAMLMTSVQTGSYAFSVKMASAFQDVMGMVKAIPGTTVTIQNATVTRNCPVMEQMMVAQQTYRNVPENVILIVSAQAICYAFSVRMVKMFQDALEMVMAIHGIIVMIQTVLVCHAM